MKIRATIAVAALGLALAAPSVFAQNSQQSKMKTCSTQNTGKKGDDYKSAMKDCLSSAPVAASAPMTQQQKMTACSKSSKGMKGDEYKSAMKSCLSSKS
jgi:hypothetical protein